MSSDGTRPFPGRMQGFPPAGRVLGTCLLAALALAAAAPVSAQEEQAPEAAERQHEVDRGDTLWDLARRFLSDPFDWRRIYQLNQEKIQDPHWIYPGQMFAIPGAGTAGEGEVTRVEVREREPGPTEEGEEAAPEERQPAAGAGEDPFAGPSIFDQNPQQQVSMGGLSVGERPPPALVSRSDFYKVAFLDDYDEVAPRGTTARVIRENPLELEMIPTVGLRDRVVIALDGGLSVEPGDTLQAVKKKRSVGPRNEVIASLGLVEVRRVAGDSARGVVTAVYGAYRVGDPVVAAEPFHGGTVREHRPAEGTLRAEVTALSEEQVLVGTGDVAFLDVGDRDGVRPGDEFAVFPDGELGTREFEDRLGVLRVVRVRPGTATARVVETRDVGIRVGLPAVRFRRPASGAE